jgi:enoyl-CoA hydratase/carnithine racemase
MQIEDLIIEQKNGVGHIILNRPKALNSINLNMVRAMHACLKKWASDKSVNVVVVSGAGDRAFCAGGDIRSLYESMKESGSDHLTFFEEEFALNEYIYTYPKPYIAFIDGYVMGGGMGISQGASYRIATERTKLSMPETAIGYFPDVGGSYFLSRCPDSIGIYLGLTGKSIQAQDAVYSQLADWVMNSENFPKLLEGLEGLDTTQPLAPQIDGILKGLGASNYPTDANFSQIGKQINQCFSLDTVEAIELALQELEQEAPAEWIAEALNKMSTNSPIAMAGTLRMIQTGKSLDLSQCFAMELVLAKHWMAVGDFIEGIRALIIDKDNAPKWRYKKSELSPKELNSLLPELYPH